MSVQSKPYYWLVCDGCGVKSTEDHEISAWDSESTAVDQAQYRDWRCDDDKHLCDSCRIDRKCEGCDKTFDKGALDEDLLCADCRTAAPVTP